MREAEDGYAYLDEGGHAYLDHTGAGLLAYPAQSNFSGRARPAGRLLMPAVR